VLSTQNPVDLDYKAMANASTWLVGRLQTENDKARVLEGLRSAAGGTDVAALDAAIGGLQKRQFLLKTRHTSEMIAGAGAVLGALLGGRRSTRSMAGALGSAASRRGMSARAAARREAAEEKAEDVKDDLAELEQDILDEVAEIDERWRAIATEVETVAVRLEATDARVLEMRLVWVPSA
jgi:hypothetical protein